MMKGNGKYYLLLGALLVLYIVVMVNQPGESKVWAPSFSKEDKTPYGAFLLYERLPDLFVDSAIYSVKESSYQLFSDEYYHYPTDYGETYVAINTELPWDAYETGFFLRFVAQGNYAFLSALAFSPALRDSLGIEETEPFPWLEAVPAGATNFYSPALKTDSGFVFEEILHRAYFSAFDTARTTVLAHNGDGRPNLIKVKHGEGFILLSTTPYAFTNYHLLHKNHYRFIAGAFSYFPDYSYLMWDEYYKYWNLRAIAEGRASGRLGYILNQRALRWAWYLLMGGLLIFVAFEMKRKQRMVPIVKPLPNLTLEFTETIGRLYFQSGDHYNLAEKKIKVFLEQLRSRYFLRTDHFDDAFFRTLSGKSGVAEEEIRSLFRLLVQVNRGGTLSEENLIALCTQIDRFYLKAGVHKTSH